MKFTTTYKNCKPEHFFIKLDKPSEFSFIQPYFLVTSINHKRHGRIKELECLFSGSVFIGKQYHGFGYSCSADVYGELINIINKLHGKKLSERAKKELRKINTHEDGQKFSRATLEELQTLNNEVIHNKEY
jgi:hypothetical protein